jgi:chorismate mutase
LLLFDDILTNNQKINFQFYIFILYMKHKTNKKRSRRNKFNKRSKINQRSRRYSFSRRSRRSRKTRIQHGGNYNPEQIQQIINTIKANVNLSDITDEEITQFINKINPNAAIYANAEIIDGHRLHPLFNRLIEQIQHLGPSNNNTAVDNLQFIGDNLAAPASIVRANFTDGESESEPEH